MLDQHGLATRDLVKAANEGDSFALARGFGFHYITLLLLFMLRHVLL